MKNAKDTRKLRCEALSVMKKINGPGKSEDFYAVTKAVRSTAKNMADGPGRFFRKVQRFNSSK